MKNGPIKICIVEDDEDIRTLTKDVIEMDNNIKCVGAFSCAEDFISQCDKTAIDIVLMDIGLPGLSGTECVKQCNMMGLNIDFVMYTTHFVAAEVFEALKVGAKGYILKGSEPNHLVKDIMDVYQGGSPMSPQISRLVIESFNQLPTNNDKLEKLTKQEKEILYDLEKGLNYKEIANKRYISPHTVRAHIRTFYEKLVVHTKLEAVRFLINQK